MRRRILIGMLILPGFITSAPTAKTLTYNGSAQQLVNAGSGSGPMVYSLDNITYSSTIPTATNAGTYTVYYKVEKYKKYDETAPAYVSCTMSSKTVTQPTITLSQTSYQYDGSNKTPSVTSVKDGSVTIPSSEYTVSYSNNKNAGTATVSITDKSGGNYTVSGTETFTITKATPTITAAPTNRNASYTGSAQALLEGGTANVTGTFTYATATNAGTYNNSQWTFTPTDTTNYNTVTGTVNATIAKINPIITAPTAKTLTYTGSAQTLLNSGTYTTPGTFTYGNNSGTNAGDYYPTWNFAPTDSTNYNTLNGSVKVTISRAAATLPGTISGDRKDTDHTPARATVSKDYVGGTLQYSTNNGSSWSNVTWYSGNLTANPSNSTIGDVSVKFVVNPDTNHIGSAISDPITLTVTKATDPSVTVSLSSTLTYTGSAQTIATASNTHGVASYYIGYKKGSLATADSQVTWNSASTTPLKATDAGDYYVYYKFTADSSHSGNKAYTYVGKVTINKQTLSSVTMALSWTSKSYNGSVQVPTATVKSGSTTLTSGTHYTLWYSNSSSRDAGSYSIAASATGNYSFTAVGVAYNITKIDPTYTAPTAKILTYTGSAQALVNAGSNTTGGSFKYTLNSSTYNTPPTATNAGSYTVRWTFTPTDSTNFNTKTGTISVTIAKKSRTITLTNPGTINTGEPYTLLYSVSEGANDGTVSVASGAGINASGVKIIPIRASNCSVSVLIVGGSNYANATSSEVTFTATNLIDLGLPSGVRWCTHNVTSSSDKLAYDPGLYFSWGNPVGHSATSNYNWGTSTATSPYVGSSGYGRTTDIPSGNVSYDGARYYMNSPWRMPTFTEVKELYNKTNHEYDTMEGVFGIRFISKKDSSKHIFLPAGGRFDSGTTRNYYNTHGFYWNCEYHSTTEGHYLSFLANFCNPENYDSKHMGLNIRAVI